MKSTHLLFHAFANECQFTVLLPQLVYGLQLSSRHHWNTMHTGIFIPSVKSEKSFNDWCVTSQL